MEETEMPTTSTRWMQCIYVMTDFQHWILSLATVSCHHAQSYSHWLKWNCFSEWTMDIYKLMAINIEMNLNK